MSDLNSFQATGRVTRDPEFRTIPSGEMVASFGMAINRNKKVGEEWKPAAGYPVFLDVTAWGFLSEKIEKKGLAKGDQVVISGELRLEEWNDKETGDKRRKISVTANWIDIHPKGEGGGRDQAEAEPERSASRRPAQRTQEQRYEDQEIPF